MDPEKQLPTPAPDTGRAPTPNDPGEAPKTAPDTLIFRILMVVAVLGVIGYFGGKFAWRRLRVHRAHQQCAIANQLIEQQLLGDAQKAVRTAIQLAPNDPMVLRTTATWCSLTGRPEGLMYWDRLFQVVRPTRQDRLKKLDLALILHRLDISRDLLKSLLKDNEKDREVLVRAIQHHIQTGRPGIAIKAARIALTAVPDDLQTRFLLGSLLHEIPDRGAQEEARRILWSIALEDSKWRNPSVDLLVQSQLLNDGDRLLLVRSIESRTNISLRDHLLVLDLRRGLIPKPESLWKQAEDLTLQYPGVTNQLYIAQWLAASGGTNRALALLPRAAAGTNAAAAVGTLEMLMQLRAWDEVRRLLDQTPVALPPTVRDAAEGVYASAAGRTADVDAYFANARQKASGHPMDLIQIAAYAELANRPTSAAEILIDAATLNPLLTVQLCQKALGLVRSAEDLSVVRNIIERLADFLPGEAAVLIERSWYDLLFEENLDRAKKSLTEALDHPNLGSDARVLLALADLKGGDASAALGRLEAMSVEPSTLAPRFQAVYAAILMANGQREPARRLARQIKTDKLKQKELELIAGLE